MLVGLLVCLFTVESNKETVSCNSEGLKFELNSWFCGLGILGTDLGQMAQHPDKYRILLHTALVPV